MKVSTLLPYLTCVFFYLSHVNYSWITALKVPTYSDQQQQKKSILNRKHALVTLCLQ